MREHPRIAAFPRHHRLSTHSRIPESIRGFHRLVGASVVTRLSHMSPDSTLRRLDTGSPILFASLQRRRREPRSVYLPHVRRPSLLPLSGLGKRKKAIQSGHAELINLATRLRDVEEQIKQLETKHTPALPTVEQDVSSEAQSTIPLCDNIFSLISETKQASMKFCLPELNVVSNPQNHSAFDLAQFDRNVLAQSSFSKVAEGSPPESPASRTQAVRSYSVDSHDREPEPTRSVSLGDQDDSTCSSYMTTRVPTALVSCQALQDSRRTRHPPSSTNSRASHYREYSAESSPTRSSSKYSVEGAQILEAFMTPKRPEQAALIQIAAQRAVHTPYHAESFPSAHEKDEGTSRNIADEDRDAEEGIADRPERAIFSNGEESDRVEVPADRGRNTTNSIEQLILFSEEESKGERVDNAFASTFHPAPRAGSASPSTISTQSAYSNPRSFVHELAPSCLSSPELFSQQEYPLRRRVQVSLYPRVTQPNFAPASQRGLISADDPFYDSPPRTGHFQKDCPSARPKTSSCGEQTLGLRAESSQPVEDPFSDAKADKGVKVLDQQNVEQKTEVRTLFLPPGQKRHFLRQKDPSACPPTIGLSRSPRRKIRTFLRRLAPRAEKARHSTPAGHLLPLPPVSPERNVRPSDLSPPRLRSRPTSSQPFEDVMLDEFAILSRKSPSKRRQHSRAHNATTYLEKGNLLVKPLPQQILPSLLSSLPIQSAVPTSLSPKDQSSPYQESPEVIRDSDSCVRFRSGE